MSYYLDYRTPVLGLKQKFEKRKREIEEFMGVLEKTINFLEDGSEQPHLQKELEAKKIQMIDSIFVFQKTIDFLGRRTTSNRRMRKW